MAEMRRASCSAGEASRRQPPQHHGSNNAILESISVDGWEAIEASLVDNIIRMSSSQPPKKGVKKSVVDHTYRDYASLEITDLIDHYKGLNEDLFPSKLHRILSTPEYAHMIAWRPHGRAWKVVNRSEY